MSENSNKASNLFRAREQEWPHQRYVINPTFSSAKLKFMFPPINGCIEAMLNQLSQMMNAEQQHE
ncbi:unnamed protein product, partial [Rotaria sp. Silwood1]